jgi:hypothetical protein
MVSASNSLGSRPSLAIARASRDLIHCLSGLLIRLEFFGHPQGRAVPHMVQRNTVAVLAPRRQLCVWPPPVRCGAWVLRRWRCCFFPSSVQEAIPRSPCFLLPCVRCSSCPLPSAGSACLVSVPTACVSSLHFEPYWLLDAF